MIDYEKLKIAHVLSDKINNPWKWINTNYSSNSGTCEYRIIIGLNSNEQDIFIFEELEDLIKKLTELTQPEPKYKIGQEVWYFDFSKEITNSVIKKIDLYDHGYRYIVDLCISAPECNLYPTKQAIIEAQISMWQSMSEHPTRGDIIRENNEGLTEFVNKMTELEQQKEECQHESDGNMLLTYPGKYRCKKCGEFYR